MIQYTVQYLSVTLPMERPLIDGQEKELFHHEKLAIVKGKVLVIIELIEYSITFVKKISRLLYPSS